MDEYNLTVLVHNKYTWKISEDGHAYDCATGLLWFTKEKGEHNFEQAMTFEDQYKRLPTVGELKMAWERGLSEVFKDNNCWFRSSSENDYGYAWYFNGSVGRVAGGYRDSDSSVRCVSRSGR